MKKKVVALLTGRGNNTLKDKNVRRVLGKPLLYYPAKAARKSRHITDFYVSSDCDKILNAAAEVGYKRIRRPEEFARPDSRHVDAITHALEVMKLENVTPDILVVLLANCATTKTEWIDNCIEHILNDGNISAVVPVNIHQDYHPYRAKKLGNGGFLDTFFDFEGQDISTNRQDLCDSYFLCHNFWVLHVKKSVFSPTGQPPWTFMGSNIKPYVVENTFDVHEIEDLYRTKKWLKVNYQE